MLLAAKRLAEDIRLQLRAVFRRSTAGTRNCVWSTVELVSPLAWKRVANRSRPPLSEASCLGALPHRDSSAHTEGRSFTNDTAPCFFWCCLTFELRRDQRHGARPVRCMITKGAARAWWLAVGPRLERRVRPRCRRLSKWLQGAWNCIQKFCRLQALTDGRKT